MSELEIDHILKDMLKQDFTTERTEAFKEDLFRRCQDILAGKESGLGDADGDSFMRELEDEELELLAAAGDMPVHPERDIR